MTIGFDTSILTAWYNARSGAPANASGTGVTGAAANQKYAPTAPWSPTAQTAENKPALQTAAVKQAMLGHKLIDENAAQLDLKGASDDYRKLFALYNGLNTLSGVADQMKEKGLTTVDKDRIKAVFAKGLAEITSYADGLKLDQARITRGQATNKAKTTIDIGRPGAGTTYVTPPLVSGDISAPVDALAGNVAFNIQVVRVGVTHDIAIDLSQMGSTPRTLGNVVTYINDQLAASGVATRVATQRNPGGDRTIKAGGKDVKIGTNPDTWSLKVNVDSGDTVTFQPLATAPAVYVAQTVGNPNPDHDPTTKDGVTNSQLVKIQTDTSVVDAPVLPPGQPTQVDGEVWSQNLESSVGAVHATQVGPDGSVYVLADVTGKVASQDISGAQDVALMKYDSAGKLVYTRTLGAAGTASGLSLGISADGHVAVAGKLTGALSGAVDGALNSGPTGSFADQTDSFVTLYNAQGEEQWTERRAARLSDEATHVAFGADGTVYVAGRSQSALPGGSVIGGGWDSYIEGFSTDAAGKPQTLFTQTVGSAGADRPGGLVVDGTSLVLADNEDGHAVLHRFDLSGGTPSEVATRDLGDLVGGDIAGLALNGGQLVIAGTSSNPALSAGTVTRAASGGADSFVAQIAADLSASVSDSLAYYGGSGSDKVAGLSVSGGKVFITGQSTAELPGLTAAGTKDTFVAQIDVAAGNIDWSRRFTGKDGFATPSAIAVDAGGASALDRLGLPVGTLLKTDSQQLSAASSLRPGDSFQVRTGLSSAKTTVTIAQGETLDTLAAKLNRAFGFQASVKVTNLSGKRTLQITPISDRDTVELFNGPPGKDALSLLGIPDGVVRNTIFNKDGKQVPSDGKAQIYGLNLDDTLNLDTASAISHVAAQLAQAQGVIRTAYKDLQEAATPDSVKKAQAAAKASGSGAVPAYLTNQIANYQQALSRLTGGG